MIRAPKRIAAVVVAETVALSVVLPSGGQGAPGEARGTLSHKGKVVALAHAHLVTGPDAVDARTAVRRLILSGKGLGVKTRARQTTRGTDGEVTEGLVVDIDGGPRLNYRTAISGPKVQQPGTQRPAVLEAGAGEPKRLTVKLSFDDTPSSGPKVDVEFDAARVKEFKATR